MEQGRPDINGLIRKEQGKLSAERKSTARSAQQQRQKESEAERTTQLITRLVTPELVSRVIKNLSYSLQRRKKEQDSVSGLYRYPFWGESEAEKQLVLQALEKRLSEEAPAARSFKAEIDEDRQPAEGYEIGDNRAGAFVQTGGGSQYFLRVTMYI